MEKTDTSESLSFKEIRELFKETDRRLDNRFKETDSRFKETDRRVKETDKRLDRRFKETDSSLKETDRILKEQMQALRAEIGGIGNTNGDIAEDFFYSGLKKSMKLLNNDIEYIERNVRKYSKKLNLKDEFDIILENTDIIIIVEVKYKAQQKHIKELKEKKIPNYKKLFPKYSGYKLLGAIASFTFDKGAIELAKDYGFYILTQSGENIELINSDVEFY